MKRYSDNHAYRNQPRAPYDVKETQREPVWQGPVGMTGLDIDYHHAWDLWCAAIDGHMPTIEHAPDEENPRTGC